MNVDLKTTGDGALEFGVQVKVKASRTRLVGVTGGALVVAVAAPPVDGEANAELVRFLARQLRVPKSQIRIVGGATSRHKRVAITGTTSAAILRDLGP